MKKILLALFLIPAIVSCSSEKTVSDTEPRYNNDFMNYRAAKPDSNGLVNTDHAKYNNDYANYTVAKPDSDGRVTTDSPKYNNDYANYGSAKKPAAVAEAAPAKVTHADSDSDGVADDVDQCPNTQSGVKVNSLGCPMDQAVEFKLNVQFDNGKAVVKNQYHGELAKMAELLKKHDDMGAEIQGHTDNVGKEAGNVKLSDERALNIKKYLANKLGANWSHMTSKGYGSSKPVADNASAEGREKNRRVMVVLQSLETIKNLKTQKKAEEAATEAKSKKKN